LLPQSRHVEISTALSADDLDCWQASAARLETFRSEEKAGRDAGDAAQLEAEQAEREYAKAVSQAKQLAMEAAGLREAQLEEQRVNEAALADAARRAAEARASMEASKETARRRAATSSQSLDALRESLAKETQAAKNAEEKAANALTARDNAKDLPALRRQRTSAQSKATALDEECKQLRGQIKSVRVDTDAALQGGNSARVETMEARVALLEKECNDLQKEVEGGSSPSTSGVAVAEVEKELAKVQESNKLLFVEIKAAKAAQDGVLSMLADLEKNKQSLQSRCQSQRSVVDDINRQLSDHKSRRISGLKELEAKRAQVTMLEERARQLEEEVKTTRQKQQEAMAQAKLLKAARQRHEQKSDLLVWQLQNALTQLEKEKPGAPLSRCLMTSRPREKFKNGCKPRSMRDGSDAGSESVDADVSTTAGESVADALIELGSLAERA
jgi:chromosome segregation ATPase